MASEDSPVASSSTTKRVLETEAIDAPSPKRMRNAPEMPPPSFSCSSNPLEMVIFLVGKAGEEETFTVHKELARYYSLVLRAAFNSDFEEGQTQIYRLEDIGPGAFCMLV